MAAEFEGLEESREAENPNYDPRVQQVYSYIRRVKETTARREWAEHAIKNRKFVKGEQWDDQEKAKLKASGMLDIVYNKILPTMRHSTAFVTASSPGFVVKPVGGGSDALLADVHRAVLEKIGADNYIEDVAYDVAWDAKVDGVGWFVLDTDETKLPVNSIRIRRGDPLNFIVDNNSNDKYYRDADFIIYMEKITRKEAASAYGLTPSQMSGFSDLPEENKSIDREDEDYDDNVLGRRDPDDTQHEKPYYIEAWLREEIRVPLVVNLQTGAIEESDTKANATRRALQLTQMGESVKPIVRKEKRVRRVIIVGNKLISDTTNPVGKDAIGEPVIPFFPVPNVRIEGPCHMADVTSLRDPQKEKNKRRSQLIYYASVATNAPWVGEEGSFKPNKEYWERNAAVPAAILEYAKTAKNAPKREQPARLPEAYIHLETSSNAEIDDISGMNDAVKGVPPTSDASGKMVLALQEFATMGFKPFLRQLETAMAMLGNGTLSAVRITWQIPDLVRVQINPQVEVALQIAPGMQSQDPMQMQMQMMALQELMQKSNEANQLAQVFYDPTVGSFDVKVEAGSTMPANRMAKLEFALQMHAQGIYDAEAVLEYIDDPVKYDVLRRRKMAFEQARIMMAMEQIAAEEGVPASEESK
jgi:hypothetical protein